MLRDDHTSHPHHRDCGREWVAVRRHFLVERRAGPPHAMLRIIVRETDKPPPTNGGDALHMTANHSSFHVRVGNCCELLLRRSNDKKSK